MTEGVKDQEVAAPEQPISKRDENFRKLEEARDREREERIKAQMQAEMLTKELQEIRELLKPQEADPLEYEDLDPELRSRLEAKLAKERSLYERKAEEIAKQTYSKIEQEKIEAEKKNFMPKLRKEYKDYDQVMSEENIARLEQKDPKFLRMVLMVPDEYERRKATYERLKELEDKPSVKDKVKENQKNPFFIPTGSGPTTHAVNFDLNTAESRQAAYKMLKDRQKRPLEMRPK